MAPGANGVRGHSGTVQPQVVFTSCNTSVESEKIAGKWLLDDSRFEKGYMAGDQKDYDLVKKFLDAYENMDPQGMVDLSADTVKFHPADIAGVMKDDILIKINGNPAYNFQLHEIISIFHKKENNLIRLTLMRNNKKIKIQFNLKKII